MIVGEQVAPKIDSITLNTPRTRQSLVKGERLVRHGMGAVLPNGCRPRPFCMNVHTDMRVRLLRLRLIFDLVGRRLGLPPIRTTNRVDVLFEFSWV